MYSDGSTSSVLMCVVLLCFDNFDGGVGASVRAAACMGTPTPPECQSPRNATLSITLHSVSKLRLPLSIRAYLGHYAEFHSWK
jgi:hypothetical protein